MDKFETEKGNEEPMDFCSTDFSSEWRFNGSNHTNTTTGLSNSMVICKGDFVESSSCSSASMVDSFCPPIWDQPTNSQTLGFNDIIAVQNNAKTASNAHGFRKGNLNLVHPPRIDMSWAPLNSSIPKEAMFLSATSPHVILPQSFSNCPTDSGFIERAARFSCFSGGNFGDMANPFCIPESVSPAYPKPHEVFGLPCGQFQKNENEAKPVIGGSGNESDGGDSPLANAGAGNSGRGHGSKKRKRSGQSNENDQGKGIVVAKMENDNNNPTSTINKPKGNQSKEGNQGSDAVKEEYIHVRARRGQATNSHSLAERVRREKISERMKFLQDLVPGCSKVTGKAVMLDEIINYVQSLQRQVEFLSMKLATVNPRLEFNIEGLLTNKDMIHAPVGPSSSLSFPPDMSMPPPPSPYPHLHPPQPGLNQQHTHPMGESSSSDALRRTINSHLSAMSVVLKDPNPQVPNVWEDELNNIVQMGFNSRATLDGQELIKWWYSDEDGGCGTSVQLSRAFAISL